MTVCDPENFQIPLHQIATYSESKIEFLECGASGTLLILPIDITNAIKNPTFKKCLDHFRLLPSLIENGKWASVRTGEIVQANSSFVIWALSAVNNINCFQTLETQINDTQKMVLKSLIWAFPKSEMFRYDSFLSLVRSWLADNVPQRYRVVVCDPNMSMPTTASAAGKWPRGRAHHRPSPILQNTPDSVQVGLVRGRGAVIFMNLVDVVDTHPHRPQPFIQRLSSQLFQGLFQWFKWLRLLNRHKLQKRMIMGLKMFFGVVDGHPLCATSARHLVIYGSIALTIVLIKFFLQFHLVTLKYG